MKLEHLVELKKEIDHIFESGANEIRILEMVDTFIDRRFYDKESCILKTDNVLDVAAKNLQEISYNQRHLTPYEAITVCREEILKLKSNQNEKSNHR